MQDFRKTSPSTFSERHKADIEQALLAAALKGAGEDGTEATKQVWAQWLRGMFTAAVFDITTVGESLMRWDMSSPTTFDLHWHSPTGFVCALARVYQQPDGSWAALVNAGVGQSGPEEAMAKAEWATQLLTAG